MARTGRRKGKTSMEPEMKQDYDGLMGGGHHPPPPPDMNPSGAAGYTSYSGTEYGSHDLSHPGGSPGGGRLSPHSSNRAYFPSGAPTGGSGEYAVDENIHHSHHLPPLSEALHSDEKYHYNPPTSSFDSSTHHGEIGGHHSYDQGSNNFFDPQIMDSTAPAGSLADSRHGSIHAANGNGAGGHYNAGLMTPPPVSAATAPGGHAGFASSPFQPTQATNPAMFHRASISGPVMHSHYPPPQGTPNSHSGHNMGGAAPTAGDMAAWGTPSGSARPHTADGMFGSQMGSLPPQWAASNMSGPADYASNNRVPRGSNASMTSLADGSQSGKVFSYMPNNGDDSSSVGGSESQSGSGRKKRPRRRFDEIERLYSCNWVGCQKSYGTLNHLNAHVAMQKHGSKRSPGEFKEMRKAWRKSKREDEQRRQANQAAANEEVLRNKMMFGPTTGQPFMPHAGGGGGYQMNTFASTGGGGGHVMPPPGQLPRYSMHPQQQSPATNMYGSPASAGVYPSHVSPFDPSGRGYTSSSPHQQGVAPSASTPGSSGLGAYLMAHRGSI